ncbi:MAG: NUDIX hydrolase [Candidatus Heimdallarchaeota archaeon]
MTDNVIKEGSLFLRSGGLIVKDKKVLLHKSALDDFWTIPGGSIKLFETSEEAIKREYLEEIDIEITVERLLWIVENFFEYDEKNYHSLELYYLVSPMNLESKLVQNEFYGEESDFHPEKYGTIKLTYRWFSLEELDAITIQPKILKEELKDIPKEVKHLRTSDFNL